MHKWNLPCKKRVLPDKAIWYKSLDPAEKEKLLPYSAEWYISLDPEEKKSFCPNQQIGINHLVLHLLSSRAIWYNHWILHKNKRE